MQKNHFLKSLLILAISVLLNAPGIVMADHMHDPGNDHEEVQCEVCSLTAPASSDRPFTCDVSAPKHQEIPQKADFIPLETYLFHRHQRGPPLLR